MSEMDIKKLIISIAIPQLTGIIASFFTSSSVSTWYNTLQKPFFTPPGWIFGPAWTIFYLLMGVSFYLIWKKGLNSKTSLPLKLFSVQLGFNFLWSFLFFSLKSPLLGFIDIILLIVFLIWTTVEFYNVDKKAGLLLVPYLIWVVFATALNLGIILLNM